MLAEDADNVSLQFDQFARYTIMSDIVRMCFPSGQARLLDVGAGPSELTPRFLTNFYKERVTTDIEDFGRDDIVVVPPGVPMPFADVEFDVAIAMDVLEHVRPQHREQFIADMIRVARLVVIAAPIGCRETRFAESVYEAAFHDIYDQPFTFLREHTEYGLPVSGDVITMAESAGVKVLTTDCAPLDEWLASNLIDLYLSTVNDGYRVKHFLSRKMNRTLALRKPQAWHYRRFYILTREDALVASLAELPPSTQPHSETWNSCGAHLILARMFRDYAAAYDAPFIDDERNALPLSWLLKLPVCKILPKIAEYRRRRFPSLER